MNINPLSYRFKIFVIKLVFLSLTLALVFKLTQLQLFKHQFYLQKATKQNSKTIELSSNRGNVYDRNQKLLATSIESQSAFLAPIEIKDKKALSQKTSVITGIPADRIFKKINNQNYFVWLKRQLSPHEYKQLKNIKEVHFVKESKRVYLNKNLGSHILGFVGIDHKGLAGIERQYEKWLVGNTGKMITEIDARGKEIHIAKRFIQQPTHGHNIQLTIDEYIQYIAEREARKVFVSTKAEKCTVLIMDNRKGEILAMVSLPAFNPNRFWEYPARSRINHNVQSVYEPGSTFKIFTMAAALHEGLVKPQTLFVNGRVLEVQGAKIREAHDLNFPDAKRPIEEILIKSLNIGSAKLGLKLGKKRFYSHLKKFGFGQKTSKEFAGETAGILLPPDKWSKSDEAIIPFGQSIAVSPLQLLVACSVLANNGIMVKPKLIKRIWNDQGDEIQIKSKMEKSRLPIINARSAWQVREMMFKSVEQGTGQMAKLSNYTIAGKTGTAQKARPGGKGYIPGKFVASFLAMAPAHKPVITMLAMVDSPQGRYYGGEIAAPLIRNISAKILPYLNVAPDKIVAQTETKMEE